MSEEDKKSALQQLIEVLCDVNFSKDLIIINHWIEQLKKIYANKYRHTYADIFFKLQEIIAHHDSEVLEILGENLIVLKEKIETLIVENPDDENLKITLSGYKKLADHINLEIGRYNFIRLQLVNDKTGKCFEIQTGPTVIDKEIECKIDKLEEDIKKMRPIATQAQRELDKLDSRLESNKISSITTLTIFSAVVLAFSGGITFEVGMLQGMASASAYRLVFIVALTGFVLFNTIFALLYLVGKLAGKSISTKCTYCSSDFDDDAKRRCGEGVCTKDLATGSVLCQIIHKYSYVLIINIILLLVMYSDFFLWLFKGQASNIGFILSQTVPLFIAGGGVLGNLILKKNYENRIYLKIRIAFLKNIVEPNENNLLTVFAEKLSNLFYKKSFNYVELYKQEIENMKYGKSLRTLKKYAKEQLLQNSENYSRVSYREHRLNKMKWKQYKKLFKEQKKS